MPGLSSLGISVSGMTAAQAGLYVTGHNMANSETAGYTRQRVNQDDFMYTRIGSNATGILQVGLGTDVSSIQQIRNKFLDLTYRQEVSKLSFHQPKMITGQEIESWLGEMEGPYNLSYVIQNLWDSLNELGKNPSAFETRDNFINMCSTFVDKVNDIHDRLTEYQFNLDNQVRQSVTRINQLVEKIEYYNVLISQSEVSGDHANDYRDSRSNCIDELSGLIDITYIEKKGRVDILAEGHELLSNGFINKLGLKYISSSTSFVEPVFTLSTSILPCDAPVDTFKPLFNFNANTPVDAAHNNDKGFLKGLLVSRGMTPGYYSTDPKEPVFTVTPWNPPIEVLEPDDPSDPDYDAAMEDYRIYKLKKAQYDLSMDQVMNYNPPRAPIKPSAPSVVAEPAIPNINDYPGGASDPDYINDMTQYNIDLASYNNYISENEDYKIRLEQYNSDYANYKTQLDAHKVNKRQYDLQMFSNEYCMISKVQRDLDTICNSIITLINDAFAPVTADGKKDYENAPYDQNGEKSFTEVFVRKFYDRFDADGNYIEEDTSDFRTMYTIGNLMINPKILDQLEGGYNLLPLSQSGDQSDDTVIQGIMDKWGQAYVPMKGSIEKMTINSAYNQLVLNIAMDTAESDGYFNSQLAAVTKADNERSQISGVSLDEEMTNMLKYQHAYNASARMLNVIDSMLDRLINGTGRAGL